MSMSSFATCVVDVDYIYSIIYANILLTFLSCKFKLKIILRIKTKNEKNLKGKIEEYLAIFTHKLISFEKVYVLSPLNLM